MQIMLVHENDKVNFMKIRKEDTKFRIGNL